MASVPQSTPPAAAVLPRSGAIRIFVVDDSSLVRAIFSRLVEAEPGLELAGTARNAEDALSQLSSLHVNVILLDLEMPGMGGMAALPQIIKRAGSAKVMVVSALTAEGAEHSVQALAAGAADTLLKPAPGGFDEGYRQTLIERIRALGYRPLRRDAAPAAEVAPVVVRRHATTARAEILAIGASTGGVHATGLVLAALPPRIGIPILITQHLPDLFSEAYAAQLRDISGREVEIAADGMELVPDRILLAPGKAHLCVRKLRGGIQVNLDKRPSVTGCMPSVDPMFASLAETFGAGTLGVVLTGMGRDGTEGARALAEVGASVVVQNEASSVVWGMPGSIAKAGLATAVLHPHDIASRIVVATERR